MVREHMAAFDRGIIEVVEVVDVHIAITEAPPRCDVEVPDNFVDSQATFYAASLTPLGIQALGIVLPLTLLDVLATSKSP
jgi:hypothetical protein